MPQHDDADSYGYCEHIRQCHLPPKAVSAEHHYCGSFERQTRNQGHRYDSPTLGAVKTPGLDELRGREGECVHFRQPGGGGDHVEAMSTV